MSKLQYSTFFPSRMIKIFRDSISIWRFILKFFKLGSDPVEIEFTGGVADASSTWGGYIAAYAFVARNGARYNSDVHVWRAGGDPPAYIWYDFKGRRICPAKVSFLPRQDGLSWAIAEMPSKYQFLGSNDETCNLQVQIQNRIKRCRFLSLLKIPK